MLTDLLDSEKLGGEPVGGVADRVELVERQKKLGEARGDPAEEIFFFVLLVRFSGHFLYINIYYNILFVDFLQS